MYNFIVLSPRVNGEQDIQKFDTYEEAIKASNSGDYIYVVMEQVK